MEKLLTIPYLFILLPSLISIISILLNTERNKKKGLLKKPTIAGYLTIIIIVFICIIGILLQSRNEIKDENVNVNREQTLSNLKKLRDSDVKRIISDSLRFDITLKKFGQQLDQQTQTIDNINKLLVIQDKTLKQITGGDSYGYVLFFPMIDPNRNTQEIKYQISCDFINLGQYPLFNTNIIIQEPIKLFLRKANAERNYSIGVIDNNVDSVTNNSISLGRREVEKGENILLFLVKIECRNDNFDQTTKLYKLSKFGGKYEHWTWATKVWSKKQNKIIFESILPDFPRDSLGNVDWRVSSSVEEFLKSSK